MARHPYKMFRRKPEGLASGWEDKVAAFLKANGVEFKYEAETYTYDEIVYSGRCRECGNKKVVQVHKYTPDFFVRDGDGKPFIIEAKGLLDSSTRKRHRYLRDQHGELDIRLCFMTDQVLKQMKNKPRYSAWAREEGIPYCVGLPPLSWFYTEGTPQGNLVRTHRRKE